MYATLGCALQFRTQQNFAGLNSTILHFTKLNKAILGCNFAWLYCSELIYTLLNFAVFGYNFAFLYITTQYFTVTRYAMLHLAKLSWDVTLLGYTPLYKTRQVSAYQ